jgi:hypothetical protein
MLLPAVPGRQTPAAEATCVECGVSSRSAERGWKAYLTTDEDEPAEAVVYCPECDEREFRS